MALHTEARPPGIFGLAKSRVGIAANRSELRRQVAAGLLEQKRLIPSRDMPVRDDRQLLDVERNHFDPVLGDGRLPERLGRGRGLQPQGDARYGANLGSGDHRMHAADRQRRL